MKLFKDIAHEIEAYADRREAVIKVSRELLRDAKKIIFMCHEGAVDEAEKRLTALAALFHKHEVSFVKPLPRTRKPFDVYAEGSWVSAVEEYYEAWFLAMFLKKGRLVVPEGTTAPADVYVGALADFTGEIVRRAVMDGSKKNVPLLERYRRVAADIVAFMLPLYLTGQSRQKFDQAKKNLKRIEEIIYEVTIRV